MNATTIFQQAAKGEPVELLPGHMGHALTCQSTLIRGYVDARGAFQEIGRDGNPGDAWNANDLLAFTDTALAGAVFPWDREPSSAYLIDSFGILWTAEDRDDGVRLWHSHEEWPNSNGTQNHRATCTWKNMRATTAPFWPCDTPVVNTLTLTHGPQVMLIDPTPEDLEGHIHGYPRR